MGQLGTHQRDAGHVESLFRFGHGTPHDHVVDPLRIESVGPLDHLTDHDRGQFVGARVTQRPLDGFADRGADGGYDVCFIHRSVAGSVVC